MANYNVYIPKHYEDLLKEMADHDESVGQVVKRLVLGILDGGVAHSPAPDPDDLEYLQHQVERLEERLGICPNPAGPDRLDKLEEILESFKNRLVRVEDNIPYELQERLDKIESGLKSLALQFSDRLYAVIQAQEKLALDLKPAEESASPPAASPTRLPRATKRQPKTEGETP